MKPQLLSAGNPTVVVAANNKAAVDRARLDLTGMKTLRGAENEPFCVYQYRPEQIIDGDGAYWLGGIHALLGDRQTALDWLKRTVALGDVNYPWFERDKNYDSLRGDPEYQTIMAEVRQRWEAYKKEFDVAP
jgi:hypothetical protein